MLTSRGRHGCGRPPGDTDGSRTRGGRAALSDLTSTDFPICRLRSLQHCNDAFSDVSTRQPAMMLPGGAFFHRTDSFAMMRGGRLDICVLGGIPGVGHRRPGCVNHSDHAMGRVACCSRGIV